MIGKFEELPAARQQARAVLVALVFGKALLFLPEDFECGRAEKAAYDRCIKWHGLVCDECGAKKLPRHNGAAVADRSVKFSKVAKDESGFGRAAAFWASVVLIWDLRITCPLFKKHKAWRYLELASEQLGRALLAAYPGADAEGDRIYLELAW